MYFLVPYFSCIKFNSKIVSAITELNTSLCVRSSECINCSVRVWMCARAIGHTTVYREAWHCEISIVCCVVTCSDTWLSNQTITVHCEIDTVCCVHVRRTTYAVSVQIHDCNQTTTVYTLWNKHSVLRSQCLDTWLQPDYYSTLWNKHSVLRSHMFRYMTQQPDYYCTLWNKHSVLRSQCLDTWLQPDYYSTLWNKHSVLRSHMFRYMTQQPDYYCPLWNKHSVLHSQCSDTWLQPDYYSTL